MSKKKESKFIELLTRDNSEVQRSRAERIAKVTESEMDAAITELETKKLTLEDQLDSQLDVTTQNDFTSMNAIENWDAKKFIRKRVDIKVELQNVEINLEAAREVKAELFGDA